jgi:hypothetical protein
MMQHFIIILRFCLLENHMLEMLVFIIVTPLIWEYKISLLISTNSGVTPLLFSFRKRVIVLVGDVFIF